MDALRLTIESHTAEDLETQQSFEVTGAAARVGRKPGNDWVLPDQTRHISGHHFDILFKDGQYLLHDRSTNGTFLEGQDERIVSPYRIASGDRFKVGQYVLQALVQPVAAAPTRPPAVVPPASAGRGTRAVQAPPSAAMINGGALPEVKAPLPAANAASAAQTPDLARFKANPSQDTSVSNPPVVAAPSMRAPDPVSPQSDPVDDIIEAADTPEILKDMKDDSASDVGTPDPVRAPEPAPNTAMAPDTGPFGSTDGADPVPPRPFIPDDDFDLMPDAPSPQAPAAPDLVPNTPPPVVTPTLSVADALESQPPKGLGESFTDPTPLPTPFPANPAPPGTIAPAPASAPPATHTDVRAPEPEPVPETHPFLAGFLEGAEIDSEDALDIPMHELGKILGQCARICTQEIMQMLQDRASVKLFVTQEDRTMRIADGNNPMKFMPDPEAAFEALFVQPRSGYQTGAAGFQNALTDIRVHQAAMMAAVQPAMAEVMSGLDPASIEADTGGGGMLKGGNKKQWEEFITRWNSRAAAGENGMVDAFVKAYAKHYSEALSKL
ncbi:type VI secretion system-associated FHA domain protein [Tateyamaria sp. ANG-S1]|uniref:type VI secretion system-associated FHA domain protein n=1 Tax=Tateyamaria sp. ANG-S1 TaxID=1577905 RepID=UPI00057EB30A|nr:type VI secretion system-associated FHA domain protein [Tateyamaria sp. ANG-S1]KIC47721.1 hypothetical protein RA29_19080 [Tateyamaria sp. ANG-S1]